MVDRFFWLLSPLARRGSRKTVGRPTDVEAGLGSLELLVLVPSSRGGPPRD